MVREPRNKDVWREWDFERSPSRWVLSWFITDFALVAENVSIELVYELAKQVSIDKLFRIDVTSILSAKHTIALAETTTTLKIFTSAITGVVS